MAKREKRIRRSPDDARELILDAAEKTMGVEGPAALRLQDVAREAGVSHPTILHHFGSREGLVRALNQRGLDQLRSALIDRMGEQDSAEDGVARSFRAFRDGMAQRILWLMQVPELPEQRPGGEPLVEQIAKSLHDLRVSFAPPGKTVDYEDSRFIAHLVSVAGFGDAVIGARLRELTGQNEQETRTRFERWLSALIDLHVRHYHD